MIFLVCLILIDLLIFSLIFCGRLSFFKAYFMTFIILVLLKSKLNLIFLVIVIVSGYFMAPKIISVIK